MPEGMYLIKFTAEELQFIYDAVDIYGFNIDNNNLSVHKPRKGGDLIQWEFKKKVTDFARHIKKKIVYHEEYL